MTEKRILFGKFEFPVEKGLEYLVNENIPETDFLCINEPHDTFSIMFEKDFPIFTVPEHSDRDYCLFELKRSGRVIKFFCPERHKISTRRYGTFAWSFMTTAVKLTLCPDRYGLNSTVTVSVKQKASRNLLNYSKA